MTNEQIKGLDSIKLLYLCWGHAYSSANIAICQRAWLNMSYADEMVVYSKETFADFLVSKADIYERH